MAKLIVLFAFLALASAGKVCRENSKPIDEELLKVIPEGEEQANGLIKKLQAAISNTIAETQKNAEAVLANILQTNEKLAKKITQAYEDFIKLADELQKMLDEAATQQ